ncbi:hypothetical protein [uncultured Jatrophihabitans sp.]|uniref:hypothetical protein n=1 Tax=uncultured Jatrophihabitans sp. TaxID=1610747 RepID=UPI0035CA59D0
MAEPEHVSAKHRPRPQPGTTAVGRTRRSRNRRGVLATLVVSVAVIVAVVLIVVHGRTSDSGTTNPSGSADDSTATIVDSGAANAFLAGATTDIVAVTTYDYRSLDTTLSNGETVTTGAYRTSFRAALTGSLATEAKRAHRVQTFASLAAGIGQIAKGGASAKVMIFGAQSVTDDTTGGKAKQTLVTLTATIERQGSRYLVADLSAGGNAGLPAGTAGLRAAAEAGRSEVAAVLTLRHDHFDADYNVALAGAVEPLRTTLTSQAAATRQRITKGGYDLAGTVTAVAVQRAAGDTLVLLVAATGARTAAGKTSVVVDGRYRVTVVRVGSRWVTSSIDAVMPS